MSSSNTTPPPPPPQKKKIYVLVLFRAFAQRDYGFACFSSQRFPTVNIFLLLRPFFLIQSECEALNLLMAALDQLGGQKHCESLSGF